MKVSVFMPMLNPETRGDTYLEAIVSHLYWADELVVIDGGSIDGSLDRIRDLEEFKVGKIRIETLHWPADWNWSQFAKTWNFGLYCCDADWVAAGETDHVFHENQASRVRGELWREMHKGKAVVKCQKLQSGIWNQWSSKSQMYYFISKKRFPNIRYGFDPNTKTDLAHPIWWEGSMYDGIPAGVAIIEGKKYHKLIGGTGANLYNYLWTFKTYQQVCAERLNASRAWNKFDGFTKVHNVRWPEDPDQVNAWVKSQILSVREKANRFISLDKHPAVIQERLKNGLIDDFIGSEKWHLP